MSSFKIRPRFRQEIETQRDKIEKKILEKLKKEESLIYNHLPGHIYIKIHPNEQHFWSPQLHLSFEQDGDTVIIRGLYGPNPTIWAVFFFGYVALGILTMFVGMWGLTRWSLGLDATVLWSIPVFAVIAAVLYFSAQTGQKMGAQQMFDIHHFYEDLMGNKVKIG